VNLELAGGTDHIMRDVTRKRASLQVAANKQLAPIERRMSQTSFAEISSNGFADLEMSMKMLD